MSYDGAFMQQTELRPNLPEQTLSLNWHFAHFKGRGQNANPVLFGISPAVQHPNKIMITE